MKKCSMCSLAKPIEDFVKNRSKPGGVASYCKKCKRLREGNRYRSKNHTSGRAGPSPAAPSFRQHGLSEAQYEALIRDQDNRCAICGRPPGESMGVWRVDHDHSHCPGRRGCPDCVRGLLCQSCNSALGQFRDDAGILQNAIDYLNAWASRASLSEPLF